MLWFVFLVSPCVRLETPPLLFSLDTAAIVLINQIVTFQPLLTHIKVFSFHTGLELQFATQRD